ncbi:hypothetical protein [Paenisporosarcina sp. TG20]|uniref:hypothetical protein n=1 Tax=Paenisporosarcina sp. TG20 TaxID=1211706 RepID=UPI000300222B|nr:hypothetical protein [Paenisporosarcina sp. TG20]
MKRPMIKTKPDTSQRVDLSVTPEVTRTTVNLTGLALEKRLRKKRSSSYVNAIKKIDAGGVKGSHILIEELKEAILGEFPDLNPYHFPVGIISLCYLGHPYEVHTLNTELEIINHYKKGEALPESMERARVIAQHPSYDFIEVYSDMLRAVSSNGDVSVIKR